MSCTAELNLSSHSLCAVDVTMSCIACLTSLTHLGLSRTYCSDSLAFNNSLAGLASLSRLRHLDLSQHRCGRHWPPAVLHRPSGWQYASSCQVTSCKVLGAHVFSGHHSGSHYNM